MSEPQRDQPGPGAEGGASASPPPSYAGPPYAGPPSWSGGAAPGAGPAPGYGGGAGPQPGVGPPPYGPVYAPPTNTYAILSLVLALTVMPPLGVYFGYKAKEQIARTGERGDELATVGLVVGWIFTGLWVLFFLVWCGFAVTMLAGMGSMWM
jgi:hypothetical protein